MPSKRVPSPKEVVKVRRQLKVGDEVLVPARVTRIGRLGAVEAVTIELRNAQKFTSNPDYIFDEPGDAA